MFTLYESSAEIADLNQQSQSLLRSLLFELDLPFERIQLQAGEPIRIESADQNETLYCIEQGFVRLERARQIVMFFEGNELLGWGNKLPGDIRYVADSPVCLRAYRQSELFAAVFGNPRFSQLWNSYLESQVKLYASLVARDEQSEELGSAERRFFMPGEPIIIQDTSPNEVYTMLQGHAEVFVQDSCVGTVFSGEIFGAMAATNNSRRSASVIAKTSCLVATMPKDAFLSLIRTRPKTVMKLIEDMSRVILSQNEKLATLAEEGGNETGANENFKRGEYVEN